MFEVPIAMAIPRFIPEIAWCVRTQATPLDKTFLECLNGSSGCPHIETGPQGYAYLSAKALLHIGIQHKRISDESERDASRSIASLWRVVELKRIKGDPGTHPRYDHPRWSGAPRCTWAAGGNRYSEKKGAVRLHSFGH